MNVPKSETTLAFAAVNFSGKYKQQLGKLRVWDGHTVTTAGAEAYLEVLEGLPGRQGFALAHCGSKDTDGEGPTKIFLLLLFFFVCFILFSCWCCCFNYFLSLILFF